MKEQVEITHTCGHATKHWAFGARRILWLESVPCPACAGVKTADKPSVHDGTAEREAMRASLESLIPPGWLREYRFHAERRWRFDYAWPDIRIALEVDGFGRHTMPKGAIADDEKFAVAMTLGWKVFRAHWHPKSIGCVVGALDLVVIQGGLQEPAVATAGG